MLENKDINKTVFNKSQLTLAIDTKFSELFAQRTSLTVDQFFISYNDLFFEINDKGVNSHQELIERSTDYLGEDLFATERDILLSQIEALEFRVAELEEVDPEHPIFKNGSFLRYDDFWDRPEGGVVFYMDKGIRRKVANFKLMETIVRAQDPQARKLSESEYSNHLYIQNIPALVMDQIELGPIFNYNDFSGKNNADKQSKTTSMLNKAIKQAENVLKGVDKGSTSPSKKSTSKTANKFTTKNSSKLRNK